MARLGYISSHVWALAGAIALGSGLRFCNLESKPLWLDEILTTVFSLGRSLTEVPVGTVFSQAQLADILTFRLGSCAAIAQTLVEESTHPPLFFCLLHSWLGRLDWGHLSLAGAVRSLPALLGVGGILAQYWLGRVAFSPIAGLVGAWVIAVSPFAVYLSQEARHYTLPTLIISLTLAGLIQILRIVRVMASKGSSHLTTKAYFLALGWVGFSLLGLYIHYLYSLALIAQIIIWFAGLLFSRLSFKAKLLHCHSPWFIFLLSLTLLIFGYLPWLTTALQQLSRPETTWLGLSDPFAPLYQTILGWVIMLVIFPVEAQPGWVVAGSSGLMLAVMGVTLMPLYKAWKALSQDSTTQLATSILFAYGLILVLAFGAIAYGQQQDLTAIPRYNFLYLPAICALIGAGLSYLWTHWNCKTPLAILLSASLVSSGFVLTDLVFNKPYTPQQVASVFSQDPNQPLLVVLGYQGAQEIALGLSFARISRSDAAFVLMERSQGYTSIWQQLSKLYIPLSAPFKLWIVAPGLRRREYPVQLTIPEARCQIDPKHHYRIGIPYQLYRCTHLTH